MRASVPGARVHFDCVSLALDTRDPGLKMIQAASRAWGKLGRVKTVSFDDVRDTPAVVQQGKLRKIKC